MSQNIEQWMRDAATEIYEKAYYVGALPQTKIAECIASHAPSDLDEAIAALDACVGCLMIQGFPADHPDVKHAYGIILKHTAEVAPSETAAQPTCAVCGHPEHTDEHAGISHLPVSKAHTFKAEIEHNDH